MVCTVRQNGPTPDHNKRGAAVLIILQGLNAILYLLSPVYLITYPPQISVYARRNELDVHPLLS
jgi:hypothetical protein